MTIPSTAEGEVTLDLKYYRMLAGNITIHITPCLRDTYYGIIFDEIESRTVAYQISEKTVHFANDSWEDLSIETGNTLKSAAGTIYNIHPGRLYAYCSAEIDDEKVNFIASAEVIKWQSNSFSYEQHLQDTFDTDSSKITATGSVTGGSITIEECDDLPKFIDTEGTIYKTSGRAYKTYIVIGDKTFLLL